MPVMAMMRHLGMEDSTRRLKGWIEAMPIMASASPAPLISSSSVRKTPLTTSAPRGATAASPKSRPGRAKLSTTFHAIWSPFFDYGLLGLGPQFQTFPKCLDVLEGLKLGAKAQ